MSVSFTGNVHATREDQSRAVLSRVDATWVDGHCPFVSVEVGGGVSVFLHPDYVHDWAEAILAAVSEVTPDA